MERYKYTNVTLAFAIMLVLGCKGQPAQQRVDVDQRGQFTGTLQHEMFYGAPGFGEDTTTDEEEPAYILHVDPPFLFRDTVMARDAGIDRPDTCSFDTVHTIQVRFDIKSSVNGKNLKTLIGKKITLDCTLYGAHTGHHHAPALTEKVFAITQQ